MVFSFIFVKETEESLRSNASHWQTLSHNVASSTTHHEWDSNSQR